MNFPGKINNLTVLVIISSPRQFHIVNGQSTEQNQKMSSEKIILFGELVVIHTQPVSKLSQPCLGSTGENGRKREKKNHEFSCVLQNLPYSKFNMYLYGWVLTFILILKGTSKDLPHFFLQLLISTCTCKSVIQRWYIHKASAKDIIFPTNLQNFVDIYKYIWWWWWCMCRGNI